MIEIDSELIDDLRVNKTFLFVDDDASVCSSVSRMARVFGVNVQTANNANAAISLLEHNPNKYFLVLADEFMPGLSGTELLVLIQARWPHIRRALISGVEDPAVLEKGFEEARIFRYLHKPMSDQQLQGLIDDACEDFISVKRSLNETLKSRLSILENAIKTGLKETGQQKLFNTFAQSYLAQCKVAWSQAGLYKIDVSNLDSDDYTRYLKQRCAASVERVRQRMTHQPGYLNGAFKLSTSLKQFGLRGLRKADRYVDGDEAAFVAMFATLKDYYAILGLEMKAMVSVEEGIIAIALGGRFTYNDLFNPLLSCVERGVELACLQIEFLMLAVFFGVDSEMDFSDKLHLRIAL